MAQTKAAHHKGRHQTLAKQITDAANANPQTRCQADNCKGTGNRTLAEHPNTKTGRPPRWQAGHRQAGTIARSLADYRPEADVCNTSDGAAHGNRLREPHTERW